MDIPRIKKEIVEHLEEIQRDMVIEPPFDDYIDVRLRLQPDGSFTVLYGDPSYDQDHRGFWGSSILYPATSIHTNINYLGGLADDLLEQALDDQAETEAIHYETLRKLESEKGQI